MSDRPLDPSAILATLAECGVDFVLIGALAVGVYGEVRGTGDVDVMVPIGDAANKKSLGEALEKLGAEQLPAQLGGVNPADGEDFPTVMFRTRFGKLDILYKPDGSDTYASVKRRSVTASVAGQSVAVVGKDDLIRMKLAAGRPDDLVDVASMTTGESGRERRVLVEMELAPSVDERWARDLAEERLRLFDPNGRALVDQGLVKLEATRTDLSNAQIELWARALAERLAGAGVVVDAEPAVKIDDG